MTKLNKFLVVIWIFVGIAWLFDKQKANSYYGTGEMTRIHGVDCIVLQQGQGTGISCNWERYNKTDKH